VLSQSGSLRRSVNLLPGRRLFVREYCVSHGLSLGGDSHIEVPTGIGQMVGDTRNGVWNETEAISLIIKVLNTILPMVRLTVVFHS
jgi:hypothetical protein